MEAGEEVAYLQRIRRDERDVNARYASVPMGGPLTERGNKFEEKLLAHPDRDTQIFVGGTVVWLVNEYDLTLAGRIERTREAS